jgi:hypothetical protein
MGMFSELKKIDEQAQDERQRKKPARVETAHKAANTPQQVNPPINRLINRPINPPINGPVNQVINEPIDTSPVIGKPKGFYITQKQDEELNDAVKKLSKKLEGKVMIKIDRSTILRLVLEEAKLASDETIERLGKQLINRLINQLTNR